MAFIAQHVKNSVTEIFIGFIIPFTQFIQQEHNGINKNEGTGREREKEMNISALLINIAGISNHAVIGLTVQIDDLPEYSQFIKKLLKWFCD